MQETSLVRTNGSLLGVKAPQPVKSSTLYPMHIREAVASRMGATETSLALSPSLPKKGGPNVRTVHIKVSEQRFEGNNPSSQIPHGGTGPHLGSVNPSGVGSYDLVTRQIRGCARLRRVADKSSSGEELNHDSGP